MSVSTNPKLAQLPEALAKAKSSAEVATAVVDVERNLLKQVMDAHTGGRDTEDYTTQDFLVGERNTRGLSWKLALLRVIAANNFCQMIRIGVHGGTTQIAGQPANIENTLAVYNAISGVMDPLSQSAFTSYSEANKDGEGEPPIHKVGWVNKFLLDLPGELSDALKAAREKDAGGNGKLAKTIEEKDAALATFTKSLAPVKAAAQPRTPKAPRAPKPPKNAGEEQPETEWPTEASETGDVVPTAGSTGSEDSASTATAG